MYQALYRKYRPKVFDDVIGQQHITESLRNQVKSGRLSHAYIFIGTRGTGKTTCSRILAKAINCENPVNGNPCCKCPSCLSIEAGETMDIVEMDAASNNGVNDVRALRDEAVFSPTSLKKRVYIIDEVHMLSTPAFNALLKILEEPPEHLVFILATTELQKVPATILSRCQRHSFHRVKNKDLAEYLVGISQKENFRLTEDAAMLIAGLGEGSVRDSLSMLDQCSAFSDIDVDQVYSSVGLAGNKRTISLFEKIAEKNTETALNEFNSLWNDGKEPAAILRELSNFGRDVLMIKVAPKSAGDLVYGGYSREELRRFASFMTVEELTCIVDSLQGAVASMRDRLNTKMTAELCLITLSENALGNTIGNLRARGSALEEAVSKGTVIARNVPASESKAPVSANNNVSCASPASVTPMFSVSEDARPVAEADTAPADHVSEEEIAKESAPAEAAGEPAPQEITPEEQSSDLPASASGINMDEFLEKICEHCGNGLRMDMKLTLKDPEKRKAYLDAEILTIEVDPGFQYSSFSRSEIIDILEKAASEVAGGSVRIRIAELKPVATVKRSLSELKGFPEVKFE